MLVRTMWPFITEWYNFGYYSGGLVNLTASLADYNPDYTVAAMVLVCTSDEFDNIIDGAYDSDHLCRAARTTPMCRFKGEVDDMDVMSWELSETIDSTDYFFFLAIPCRYSNHSLPHSVSVQVEYHFVNPGGEELSSGAVPLKTVTLVFAVAWGAIAVALCANMAFARLTAKPRGQMAPEEAAALGAEVLSPVRAINWAMAALAALLGVGCCVAWGYYTELSRVGEADSVFSVASLVVSSAGMAALTWLILGISRGWQITRLSLPRVEAWQNASLAALLFLVWTLWQSSGGLVTLFVLLLVNVLVLRYLLATSTWTLALLDTLRGYVALLVLGGTDSSGSGGGTRAPSAVSTPRDRSGGPAAPLVSTPRDRRASLSDTPLLPAASSPVLSAGNAATTATATGRPAASSASSPAAPTASAAAPSPRLPLHSSRWRGFGFMRGGQWTAPWQQWRRRQSEIQAQQRNSGLTLRQIRVLKQFRAVSLSFLTLNLVLQVWSTFSENRLPWLSFVLSQLLVGAVVIHFAWVFRARADVSEGPLFDPRGYTGGATFETLIGRLHGGQRTADDDAASYIAMGEGADSSLPLRDDDEEGGGGDDYGAGTAVYGYDDAGLHSLYALARREQQPPRTQQHQRFIVVNPDSLDSKSGQLVGPVSLAEPQMMTIAAARQSRQSRVSRASVGGEDGAPSVVAAAAARDSDGSSGSRSSSSSNITNSTAASQQVQQQQQQQQQTVGEGEASPAASASSERQSGPL